MADNHNQLYVVDLWKLSVVCKIQIANSISNNLSSKIVSFEVDKELELV